MKPRSHKIDFARINRAALASVSDVLQAFLPGGMLRGHEYSVRNPCRPDRNCGSFKINTRTGKWSDFALAGVRGADPISLVAYLCDWNQGQAARRLARLLRMPEEVGNG
jgi:putative DNA primase/helicase